MGKIPWASHRINSVSLPKITTWIIYSTYIPYIIYRDIRNSSALSSMKNGFSRGHHMKHPKWSWLQFVSHHPIISHRNIAHYLSHTHRIHGAGIYTNIWGILMVNVTIYSIHGSYGIVNYLIGISWRCQKLSNDMKNAFFRVSWRLTPFL